MSPARGLVTELTADQRWDAWRARGRAHDARLHRRWTDVAILLAILAGVVLASLADLI
ncbi:MAG: hypothetical protein AB7Q16_19485 [Vicinamibacterales bacterium]